MNRFVVNACGIQENILKHRFILIPYVLKLEGRDIPCGFFALIFFFTVYLFLESIFGHALCFL